MSNPIADYMAANDIGTVEMASRLGGLSKGYVSLLKDGKKKITPKVARRLGTLLGRPWWEFMPSNDSDAAVPQAAAQ